MTPRLLIDAIVQQTTVLVAQLSTVAGVRSPIAGVADQVFLSLAQEIERQGVGRKVVADMFGLALRSYQRKVQRLTESASVENRTLWESVLEYVTEQGPARRDHLLERFRHDDELAVTAVLSDLVTSGLVYSSGRGESTLYRVTTEADRRELATEEVGEALVIVVWGHVFHNPGITRRMLRPKIKADAASVDAALSRLLADGRVTSDGAGDTARLHSAPFVIPADMTQGWEAAVFDHYQAMVNAITTKLRKRADGEDTREVGGTTLHFGIHEDHPYAAEVRNSLERVREEMNVLWNKVVEFNTQHPIDDESATRVTFYFGQHVREPAPSENGGGREQRSSS